MKKTEDLLQSKIDNKTKPPGSLGELETLAFKIGCIQNSLTPVLLEPTICIFAGDHGIAKQGVSAFPREVTYQMVLNFLNGGAAINVFTKLNGIHLHVVDSGVDGDFSEHISRSGFHIKKINRGTKDCTVEASMTQEEMEKAIQSGRDVVREIVNSDCNLIGLGEMGIGNTSSASLLMSSLLQLPLHETVGRGTGLDDNGLKNKLSILNKAHNRCVESGVDLKDPYNALREFGGYEIAMMVGAFLESYDMNRILLIDGFIASSAFLVASKINPRITGNALFCHKSREKGHMRLLEEWDAKPILDLGLRLGEGTGCALAIPVIRAAVAFLNEMHSFAEAGVSNKD